MKKTFLSTVIAVCVIFAMAMCVSAEAPQISVISAMDGTVAVTGDAALEQYVSLTILNPGYDEEDFLTSPAEAIQYFSGAVTRESTECEHAGNYCFHAKITGVGGLFSFIVNVGGEKHTQEYFFYPAGLKLDAIAAVNAATAASLVAADEETGTTLLDEVYELFSLIGEPYYAENSKAEVAKVLIKYRDAMPGDVFGCETAEDLDNFCVYLKKVALTAAYNADKEDLVIDDDMRILYRDSIMDLAETDEIADFNHFISEAGKKKLLADLFAGTYANIGEVEEAFKDLVHFYVLVDYAERGSGHVEKYFEVYKEAYLDAGFDLDKLESKKNKKDYYTDVAASSKKTLEDLADEFNDLFKEKKKSSGDRGSVANNAAGDGYIAGTGTPIVTEPPVIEEGFNDIETVAWAKEAIEALNEKGIISGRGNGVFAPNDNVTRAEYVKIIVSAFGGVQADAQSSFADVADGWAKPYIATAVAKGFVNGITETEFAPDGKITREQAAVIIHRVLVANGKVFGLPGAAFDDDASVSAYAKEAVYALKGAGIINGRTANSFCPAETLTRAEAAKLIYSIINVQ